MVDELSSQILGQTTENIQKLFDLSTRIDERVKSLQSTNIEVKSHIDIFKKQLSEVELKILIMQKESDDHNLLDQLQQCQLALVELDKKLNNTLIDFDKRIQDIESKQQGSANRWEKITTFGIQLVWVILAAWVLAILGLEPPP